MAKNRAGSVTSAVDENIPFQVFIQKLDSLGQFNPNSRPQHCKYHSRSDHALHCDQRGHNPSI